MGLSTVSAAIWEHERWRWWPASPGRGRARDGARLRVPAGYRPSAPPSRRGNAGSRDPDRPRRAATRSDRLPLPEGDSAAAGSLLGRAARGARRPRRWEETRASDRTMERGVRASSCQRIGARAPVSAELSRFWCPVERRANMKQRLLLLCRRDACRQQMGPDCVGSDAGRAAYSCKNINYFIGSFSQCYPSSASTDVRSQRATLPPRERVLHVGLPLHRAPKTG